MNQRLILDCERQAYRKLFRHDQNYRHFSFIIRDNEVLAMGMNRHHEIPLYPNGTIHAEYCAYHKAFRRLGTSRFWCLNIRIGHDGLLRLSKPCATCYNLLKHLGCTRFVYSVENNKYEESI